MTSKHTTSSTPPNNRPADSRRTTFNGDLQEWSRLVLAQDAPDPLARLLALTKHVPAPELALILCGGVIANGGTWYAHAPGDHWPASHLVKFSLFGVSGTGPTLAEAAADWRKAARRMTRERVAS
ncbi:MAG TPA: hypothetical protein ENK28_04875 [Aliiroseovarius sp.]|nr:hypothetical protein [Aliiroseovarius sp.]